MPYCFFIRKCLSSAGNIAYFSLLLRYHLLQNGVDIRSIQELLGDKSVETKMIYTHVVAEMNKSKVISPLDF